MKTIASQRKKRRRLKTKKDWLVGRWQNVDEGFGIILEITRTVKGYRIRAFDNYDNEELVVSKTKWDGKVLRFETRVPSNNYRTRNCLTPMSNTKLVQELTFWEDWKKMPLKKDRESVSKVVEKRKKS